MSNIDLLIYSFHLLFCAFLVGKVATPAVRSERPGAETVAARSQQLDRHPVLGLLQHQHRVGGDTGECEAQYCILLFCPCCFCGIHIYLYGCIEWQRRDGQYLSSRK